MTPTLAARVAAVVHDACCIDVRALKPGNVSVYAPGHRMTATDFVLSADVAAETLSREDSSVGVRIRDSVEATMRRVGCNTNLGIILLLAPLVHAVLAQRDGDLPARLGRVLHALQVADAADAYIAIGRANPAGLGAAPRQDVARPPTVTLLEAMRLAADRDRIALQYASDFADIFHVGVPAIEAAIGCGWPLEGAAARCYLAFVARFPDSHIVRKYGATVAAAVRRDASGVETLIKACDNLRSAVPILLKMDNKLKAGGINPGTSADLTIASLAAWRLTALL